MLLLERFAADNPGDEYGHTKGVAGISSDVSAGFWLLHSVPKFPTRTGSTYDGYPTSGEVCVRMFVCIGGTAHASVCARMASCVYVCLRACACLPLLPSPWIVCSQEYGQSFLCVSLAGSEFEKIASDLLLTRPSVCV